MVTQCHRKVSQPNGDAMRLSRFDADSSPSTIQRFSATRSLLCWPILLWITTSAGAQVATWPSARARHHMAYDQALQQVLLLGGAQPRLQGVAKDTALWSWDGTRWRIVSASLSARDNNATAYDAGRARFVMHGGSNRIADLNDTWEWDGRRWREIPTAEAPSPRWDAEMIYDPIRERIVLFGGRSRDGNAGDTWEYDGRAWKRLNVTGPSPRNGHAMTYDPRTKTILLFGGRNEPTYFDDLWEFDGAWKQLPGPQP